MSGQSAGHSAGKSNTQIIRDFVAAWPRLDVDELVSFFAPDGIYHNMPTDPVQGHDALTTFIGAFIGGWSATEWDILNITETADGIVFCERLDRTMVGDKPAHLPCCGVFEMDGGKIKIWRDYFDMGTYMNALA